MSGLDRRDASEDGRYDNAVSQEPDGIQLTDAEARRLMVGHLGQTIPKHFGASAH
jgi:hypothetical protein